MNGPRSCSYALLASGAGKINLPWREKSRPTTTCNQTGQTCSWDVWQQFYIPNYFALKHKPRQIHHLSKAAAFYACALSINNKSFTNSFLRLHFLSESRTVTLEEWTRKIVSGKEVRSIKQLSELQFYRMHNRSRILQSFTCHGIFDGNEEWFF